MFKSIVAAIAIAVALAQPALAEQNRSNDPTGALLFGLIAGVILNEAINDNRSNTHVENHYHQRRDPSYSQAQRCGWYEEAERIGNRIYYYRYNACNHQFMGERWEYVRRH